MTKNSGSTSTTIIAEAAAAAVASGKTHLSLVSSRDVRSPSNSHYNHHYVMISKTALLFRRHRHGGLSRSYLLLILLSIIFFQTTPITDAFIVRTKASTKHYNIKQQSLIIQRRPSHRLPPSPSIGHYKNIPHSPITTTTSLSLITPSSSLLQISPSTAETLAGPFFAASLFPYLLFLYFLQQNPPTSSTPKGVIVGFATCLLFVFLTIPAAIVAKFAYDGSSLADCDYLHGAAESLLTVTNLVTVVAFRQALRGIGVVGDDVPESVTSYKPMVRLVGVLTVVAGMTAVLPGVLEGGGSLIPRDVHTPYLGGFMDIPRSMVFWGREEPENALTVACWIIHVSSLVEFLVAMGFVWRWADVTSNPKWKGLTWGLLPLHSSGITACTYHLFYNRLPFMVPLQALLTCIGNTTAAYAAYRIAASYGWKMPSWIIMGDRGDEDGNEVMTTTTTIETTTTTTTTITTKAESKSLIGFEDLGDALADDNDYTFLFKLFAGCAVASYVIKYGEILFDFPFVGDDVVVGMSENDAGLLALAIVFVPSGLNAFKWYKRSLDPTFEGWF